MKTLKTIGLIAVAALIIGLSITCYVLYSRNVKLKASVVSVSAAPVALKQAVIKTYVDSLTHQTHVSYTNTNANLNSSALGNGKISKGLLDTISKALDIKSSQVTSYIKISQASEAKNLVANKTIDSLKQVIYKYKTKYVDLSFTEPDSNNKGGTFAYKYTNELQAVQYSGKKFLGIPIGKDVIDISSTDPNATYPGGLSAFSITPAERFFGAEFQALTQYNLKTTYVSPGLGVQLRFGRMYLTGYEYFNLGTRQYNTLLGGRFAIFKY